MWLRKKLERRAEAAPGAPQVAAPAFLEVPVELVMTGEPGKDGVKAESRAAASAPMVVEVAAPDGSRMRIQMGTGGLDAPGLIAAFLGRSR